MALRVRQVTVRPSIIRVTHHSLSVLAGTSRATGGGQSGLRQPMTRDRESHCFCSGQSDLDSALGMEGCRLHAKTLISHTATLEARARLRSDGLWTKEPV